MEAKFIGKTRLTKQGQITLPHEGRHDLKINSESNYILVLVKELVNPKEIVNLILKKRKK